MIPPILGGVAINYEKKVYIHFYAVLFAVHYFNDGTAGVWLV